MRTLWAMRGGACAYATIRKHWLFRNFVDGSFCTAGSVHAHPNTDQMAERSKALVSGTSLNWRGFESPSRHDSSLKRGCGLMV